MPRRRTCKTCGAIRIVSQTSQFVGVDKYTKSNSYRVRATHNGKQVYIGSFKDEVKAAIAYDEYILMNDIMNKPLNFPHGRLI